jgi:DNA-binding response OmpR family regulator
MAADWHASPRSVWDSHGVPFRCLIVDDNERFLFVARRLLEADAVFEVDVAMDIASALAAIDANLPDVVLIDVTLGAESGFALLRMLAKQIDGFERRVVIISTRAEEDY